MVARAEPLSAGPDIVMEHSANVRPGWKARFRRRS